jgi:RsiW-degrading membrane proteinase PrsW (M82 family)
MSLANLGSAKSNIRDQLITFFMTQASLLLLCLLLPCIVLLFIRFECIHLFNLTWSKRKAIAISIACFAVTAGITFTIGYIPSNSTNNPGLQVAILNGIVGIPMLLFLLYGYFSRK